MIYVVCGLLALLLVLALLGTRNLRREMEAQKEHDQKRWADAMGAAYKLRTELEAAEKQIVALQGITPGRDNTGRFVKREKVSVEKV